MNENVVTLAASALTSWKAFNGECGLNSIGRNLAESINPTKRGDVDNALVNAHVSPWSRTTPSPDTQAHLDTALTQPVENSLMPGKEPMAYPFFYYRDHSTEEDPDPLTPLTLPGRVPK